MTSSGCRWDQLQSIHSSAPAHLALHRTGTRLPRDSSTYAYIAPHLIWEQQSSAVG
jgi:hypothetical protein